MTTRRNFLKTTAIGSLAGLLYKFPVSVQANGTEEKLPPIRRLTNTPKFHWRGYYDVLLFDPTDRFVLANEVDFHGRSPKPDDSIRVGMIDLQDNDHWIELGSTYAWNWQQGCLLQWVPQTESTVIWNDREKDHFVARIIDVKTKEKRTLDSPIYALSSDGKWGFYPDFARLNSTRPGYGYCGIDDSNALISAPENSGIFRINLATGQSELIIPFSKIASIVPENGFSKGAKHWFNHILVAPDSQRFLFLHRWRGEEEKNSWKTRLITANLDGSDIFVLNPHFMTSHLIWRDPQHVLAWARHPSHGDKFYVFTDKTGNAEMVGGNLMTRDGHCTYVPKTNSEWILYDTYPDKDRNQNPNLYHIPSGRVVPLGHFFLPKEYGGEWRCDLHPNASRSGHFVTIDSPHEGNGRQVYLIDIKNIID
jgi:hypothetical protein